MLIFTKETINRTTANRHDNTMCSGPNLQVCYAL